MSQISQASTATEAHRIIKGRVTSVNVHTFEFVLDNKDTFLAGLWSFRNNNIIPNLGTTVSITLKHHHVVQGLPNVVIVLCDQCHLEFSAANHPKPNEYRRIVQTYNLGAPDVAQIYKLHLKLTDEMQGLCAVREMSTVSVISNVLLEDNPRSTGYSCCNAKLGNRVKTVSQLRHVRDDGKYADFPYWSFGVHGLHSEYLVGYLDVLRSNGLLILRSKRATFGCRVFGDGCVRKLLFRFVLVKKCVFVTEIFNVKPEVPAFEVVAFDVADVVPVGYMSQVDYKVLRVTDVPLLGGKDSFTFDLVHKLNVCVATDKLPLLCLLVRKESGEEVYLMLFHSLHVRYMLQRKRKYRLVQNKPLREYRLYHVQRVMNRPVFVVDDRQAVFVDVGTSDLTEKLLTLEETAAHLSESTEMFSFTGYLDEKSFAAPFESHYLDKNLPKLQAFGTPGQKTHVLRFKTDDVNLALYLNDFDNQLMPLCLIPGMLINIRYVLPQKRKYIKVTPLTTFEIVDYKPPIPFDTVSLCKRTLDRRKQDRIWLGLGGHIPELALIYGTLEKVRVSKLTLSCVCATCGDPSACKCPNPEKKFAVKMFFFCSDAFGSFNVTSQSMDTFKRLLRMNDFQFETAMEWLKCSDYFELGDQRNQEEMVTGDGRMRFTLANMLEIASNQEHEIPIVARRMFSKELRPLYFSFDLNL